MLQKAEEAIVGLMLTAITLPRVLLLLFGGTVTDATTASTILVACSVALATAAALALTSPTLRRATWT
ncbi:hypothetical protein ACH4T9_06000 [Micromonospora sp. NPDC020750]|uniref:hypothetical protein n=1 Tax=unclassified Micromonospora TaxID=2617518 RepID=UPI00379B5232